MMLEQLLALGTCAILLMRSSLHGEHRASARA
jgi:hypothetical protein